MNLGSDHADGCLDGTLDGSVKLGQPVPLSNLPFDSNKGWPQPAHENLPGLFSRSNAQLPGASVP
jgi:hypothetical protein